MNDMETFPEIAMILKDGCGWSNRYGVFAGRADGDTPVWVIGDGRNSQEVVVRFNDGRTGLVQRRFLTTEEE